MNLELTSLDAIIRDVPDFPIKGILFKDITPLLRDADALECAIQRMVAAWEGTQIDQVVGIESRGFIFGVPLALRLGAGFVPIRKPGKLPAAKISVEYALEYGTNKLEIHEDAIRPGESVLIVDDLLATGGSARAAIDLVEQLGGVIAGASFLIELAFLHGRDKLEGYAVQTVLEY